MRRVVIPEEVRRDLHRMAFGGDGVSPGAWAPDEAFEARVRGADWRVEEAARWLDQSLARRLGRVDDAARRQALATLAASFPGFAPDLALTDPVREFYPDLFRRLAARLAAERPLDPDGYIKDTRLVLGLSVPVGAQHLDVAFDRRAPAAIGRVWRGTANLARLAAAGDGEGLRRLSAVDPWAPWAQVHTDSRDLSQFNPAGWAACYRRVAALLEALPDHAGLLGQSWFYDPRVAEISPRLAYLAEVPMAHGAVRVRLGASPIDTERAIAASPTRRDLYLAGRYLPRCWAIYWPREPLIDWARAAAQAEARARAA